VLYHAKFLSDFLDVLWIRAMEENVTPNSIILKIEKCNADILSSYSIANKR